MKRELTEKQRAVLEAIQRYWYKHGVSPSLADLALIIGVTRATVYQHLTALKKKGYLENIEGAGRSWKPTGEVPMKGSRKIPLVGRIAAGAPITAQENIEDWITVDNASSQVTLFALRVEGDSMIGENIFDGDVVIVRQQDTAEDGEIVVALLDEDSATVKKLRREPGVVHFEPANPKYKTITRRSGQVRIQGKVIGLRRAFEKGAAV